MKGSVAYISDKPEGRIGYEGEVNAKEEAHRLEHNCRPQRLAESNQTTS